MTADKWSRLEERWIQLAGDIRLPELHPITRKAITQCFQKDSYGPTWCAIALGMSPMDSLVILMSIASTIRTTPHPSAWINFLSVASAFFDGCGYEAMEYLIQDIIAFRHFITRETRDTISTTDVVIPIIDANPKPQTQRSHRSSIATPDISEDDIPIPPKKPRKRAISTNQASSSTTRTTPHKQRLPNVTRSRNSQKIKLFKNNAKPPK
jgi:hypothetical protein